MLSETLSLLEQHQYLRGEEQVDRAGLADDVVKLLQERPVTTDAEIQEKAVIVSELRHTIFGAAPNEEVESELDAILSPLTGPNGHVQKALENGYVLCTATVSRTLTHNGGTEITIKRRGRFVTTDADLIENHFWRPGYDRLVASMRTLNNRFELGVRRQPQLAPRRAPMIEQTQAQLQIEMPKQP